MSTLVNFKIKDDAISYGDRGRINIYGIFALIFHIISIWGRRGHDRLVVGFTTTCAHQRFEFESS